MPLPAPRQRLPCGDLIDGGRSSRERSERRRGRCALFSGASPLSGRLLQVVHQENVAVPQLNAHRQMSVNLAANWFGERARDQSQRED